jgi:hypothetical protein
MPTNARPANGQHRLSDLPRSKRLARLRTAWALASIVALRGLTLRPSVHLHATLPSPTPAGDDFHNVDNVRPLQR